LVKANPIEEIGIKLCSWFFDSVYLWSICTDIILALGTYEVIGIVTAGLPDQAKIFTATE
jgi:hypothetical protein